MTEAWGAKLSRTKIMSDDLKRKFLQSDAVSSLVSEQQIVAQLNRLSWSVSHGNFFIDPHTAKLREIDVVGRRWWQKKLKSGYKSIGLNLIVEVKSISGYHLVFAPISSSHYAAGAQREWVGYAGERGGQLGDVLYRAGVEPRDIASISTDLRELAYPNEMVTVSNLIVDPLPAPFVASAFRETNVGREKDLDVSVLWKAMQAVSGAVTAARVSYLEDRFDDLEGAIEYARWYGEDVSKAVVEELSDAVRRLELYHPIIVVDAKLWAADNGELTELPWCRFHQLSQDIWPPKWCDIVQMSASVDYLRELTKHYAANMRRVRATK